MVREIASLGSVDLVTRAGAGGRFHRRLSESLAGAAAAAADPPTLTAGKLQKRVREALARLQSGLVAEDDDRVDAAFVALHEAATATVKAGPARGDVAQLEERVRKARRGGGSSPRRRPRRRSGPGRRAACCARRMYRGRSLGCGSTNSRAATARPRCGPRSTAGSRSVATSSPSSGSPPASTRSRVRAGASPRS